MDDKLILEFTREEAFQFLTVITTLDTIAAIHTPGLFIKPDAVLLKIEQLQAFMESRSPKL